MRLLIRLIGTLLISSIARAECPQMEGIEIPCGAPLSSAAKREAETEIELKPELPMFNQQNVALDTPKEQIEALNNPTWNNAHKAALAKLYRNYQMMVAAQMIAQMQQAIVADVQRRHGLTDANMLLALEMIAKEHDLPTYNIQAKGIGLLPPEMVRVINQLIKGGSATP